MGAVFIFMKFSIIIPAHNAADRIRKCLDSIRSQVFRDYELIVICDSCEDNTEQIAKEYGAITKSVTYTNDGLARSKGLDMASGEWVLFIDDDDWWLHEYVLTMLAAKLADEDILCFSFIWKGMKYASPTSNNGALYPAVWNKCWRRSFIADTRFPNVYAESDYRFHIAMMAKNPKIVIWDMPFYYYNYLRKGSISDNLGKTTQGAEENWN